MIKHQGGCHCGQVRFQTEFDPLLVYQCNCQRCRRMGGTVSVFTVYGKEELEINGHIHEFVTSGGSGLPVHYFHVLIAQRVCTLHQNSWTAFS